MNKTAIAAVVLLRLGAQYSFGQNFSIKISFNSMLNKNYCSHFYYFLGKKLRVLFRECCVLLLENASTIMFTANAWKNLLLTGIS